MIDMIQEEPYIIKLWLEVFISLQLIINPSGSVKLLFITKKFPSI